MKYQQKIILTMVSIFILVMITQPIRTLGLEGFNLGLPQDPDEFKADFEANEHIPQEIKEAIQNPTYENKEHAQKAIEQFEEGKYSIKTSGDTTTLTYNGEIGISMQLEKDGPEVPMTKGSSVTFNNNGEIIKAKINVPDSCMGGTCTPVAENGQGYTFEDTTILVDSEATITYTKGSNGEPSKIKVELKNRFAKIYDPIMSENAKEPYPDVEFTVKENQRFKGEHTIKEIGEDTSLKYDFKDKTFVMSGQMNIEGANINGEGIALRFNEDKALKRNSVEINKAKQEFKVNSYTSKVSGTIDKDNGLGIQIKDESSVYFETSASGTNIDGKPYTSSQSSISFKGSSGLPLVSIDGAGTVISGNKGISIDPESNGWRVLKESNVAAFIEKNNIELSGSETTNMYIQLHDENGDAFTYKNKKGETRSLDGWTLRLESKDDENNIEFVKDIDNKLHPDASIVEASASQNLKSAVDKTITAGNRVPSNRITKTIEPYNKNLMRVVQENYLTNVQKEYLAQANQGESNYQIMFSGAECSICKIYLKEQGIPNENGKYKEGWYPDKKLLVLKVLDKKGKATSPDGSFPYFMASQ